MKYFNEFDLILPPSPGATHSGLSSLLLSQNGQDLRASVPYVLHVMRWYLLVLLPCVQSLMEKMSMESKRILINRIF